MEAELDILRRIISEVLGVASDEISMETTFTDDLGADSLDIAQIIMGVEQEFDLEIDPDSIEKIETVEDALTMIESAKEAG